jgi:hypothetical protein
MDIDALTRSNFQCGLTAIGGETETVRVVHEGHWGVGWVQWIAIHESDSAALKTADEIVAALSDYPVLDEEHVCKLEWNEAQEYWESMSVRDRAEVIKSSGSDASIFAARRDSTPEDNGSLHAYLNGC